MYSVLITVTKVDVRHQKSLVEGELENRVLVTIELTIGQVELSIWQLHRLSECQR